MCYNTSMDLTTYKSMLADAERDVLRLETELADAQSVARYCRRRVQELEQMTLPLGSIRPPDITLKLAGMTVWEAARAVLIREKRAMRVKEIAQALVESGDFKDSGSLPITILTAMRRREEVFTKVDRGLFALRNGEHSKNQRPAS